MAPVKEWQWGREGVALHDDHLTWYEFEGGVKDECDQTFESFAERGPRVNGVPAKVVEEVAEAVRELLAKQQ